MTPKPGSSTQTVSAIAVIDLANELRGLGILDQAGINGLGAEFSAIYNKWQSNEPIQEDRLPEHLLLALWQIAEVAHNSSDIGLKIGRKVNEHAKGVLANWLFQCATWSEAFDTFSRNSHLLNPSERWQRSDLKDHVVLNLQFISDNYPPIAVDRSMAACVSWSSVLIGAPVKPTHVTFIHQQPDSIAPFEDVLGKNLEFGAKENTIEFPRTLLNQPIEAANPYLKSLIEKQALEIGASLCKTKSLSEKVNMLLSKDLATYCQIAEVCDVLHLSRSTLYRKLKEEGCHYTDLVKSARIQTLQRMEKQSASGSEISEALGFNDISSYYRFRRQEEIA